MVDKGKAILTGIWTTTGLSWVAAEKGVAIAASIFAIIGSIYLIRYYRQKIRQDKEFHKKRMENLDSSKK